MSGADQFIYTPADFLGWALTSGWKPERLPVGVVYTFQSPVTRVIETELDLFVPETDLSVSNARIFMTGDDGPPVLVACLNPGAASMATQMEHLRFLGDDTRFAAIVGTAGSLIPELAIGDTAVVTSALRTDVISDRYRPPAERVEAAPRFTAGLRSALGDDITDVVSWTVPVPYRSTLEELETARSAGAGVVEMEIATLFAVAENLAMEAAAAVVISDVSRADAWNVDWSDTLQPAIAALQTTVDVIRSLAS